MELINLAIKAIFIENILLAFFLGMCSFLALSKKVETATGLGLAVIFVLTHHLPAELADPPLPADGALAWTGIPALAALDLSFLNFICFIAVIASLVQLVEMILDRFFPPLYTRPRHLPAADHRELLHPRRLAVHGGARVHLRGVRGVRLLRPAFGFFLAIVALAAIRKKLRYSNIPDGLRGLGITLSSPA